MKEEIIAVSFTSEERVETGEALKDAIEQQKRNLKYAVNALETRQSDFDRARRYLADAQKHHRIEEIKLIRLQSLQSMLAMQPDEEEENHDDS